MHRKLYNISGISEAQEDYHYYHKYRLQWVYDLINNLNADTKLEIAPLSIAWNLRHHCECDTIGYYNPLLIVDQSDKHYEYNLYKLFDSRTWPATAKTYDLVIACEIIEHIPANIDAIFAFLYNYVKPGGLLLIQTPNAVALKKRVAMLFGKNPFDLIQYPKDGHIREFTMKELVSIGSDNGLLVLQKWCKNYFNYDHSNIAKLYKLFGYLMPPSLHDGITILYKRI